MGTVWLKAINFKESNTYATGEGYFDLPVLKDDDQFISCWDIPFWERVKLLLTGRVWLYLEHSQQPEEMKKMFGGKNYHQPVSLGVGDPFNED